MGTFPKFYHVINYDGFSLETLLDIAGSCLLEIISDIMLFVTIFSLNKGTLTVWTLQIKSKKDTKIWIFIKGKIPIVQN